MQRSSSSTPDASCPRAPVAAAAALTALSLAACVMVPVDSRTGVPVTWPQGQAATAGQAAVASPVSPGPPSPMVYTARLYPVNDIANRAGMLTAVVTDGHGGRGTFSLQYLGDAMQGEASRVEAGYPGFGRVLREALGTSSDTMPRGARGIANASGTRGVSAQCEYVLSAPSKGTGACVFSDGARYQLHFG